MKNGLWINQNKWVSFAELNSAMTGEIATRRKSWDLSYMGRLPNPDPILKRMGRDVAAYRDLLSDAHVSSCVQSRKAGTLALNWEINRGGDKDKAAGVVDEIFHRIDVSHVLGEMLNATLFGYQPLEVMWAICDGLLVPVDVIGKPPEWFCFDDENRLRFRSSQSMLTGELVPDNKFLVASHEADYNNPYGLGELSRCFWPVAFKRGGWKFWSVFGEKYGMPWLIGKYPPGTDEKVKAALLDAMELAVQDALLIMPDNCSVELKESGSKGGSADTYERLITRADGECSKTLVGQTLTTEVGANGSYAAAQTHFKVRGDLITADAKMAAGIFQQLIEWICQYNFPTAQRPTLSLYAPEDVDKELAERDMILSQIGVRFTRKYFQTNYNLAEDDIADIAMPGATQGGQAFAEQPTSAQSKANGLATGLSAVELQAQADGMLKPVFDLVQTAASHEELLEKLGDIYPAMDTGDLEEKLARVIFVAETLAMAKRVQP